MSINRVMISGNLTRDPEFRQTGSGISVLTFGVAVNDRRRNPQTNEWEDAPNFVDCVLFGTRAEALQRFLSKGTKVAIEGKLRYSSWERDGQRRSKLEVIVDEIDFMSNRNGNGNGSSNSYDNRQNYQAPQQNYAASAPVQAPQAQSQQASAESSASAPQAPQVDVFNDEIPF